MPFRNGKVVSWKYHVRIKHLLDNTAEGEKPENVKKTANAIADIVEKHKAFNDFSGQFDGRGHDDVKDFNGWLSELYDYADSNLIWIE